MKNKQENKGKKLVDGRQSVTGGESSGLHRSPSPTDKAVNEDSAKADENDTTAKKQSGLKTDDADMGGTGYTMGNP